MTTHPASRFAELRKRHPRFVYERFTIGRVGRALRVQFRFRLEPEIEFAPETVFEQVDWARVEEIPRATLENYFFHLGLVEMLSYWKAACSPEIIVRAGALSAEQTAWWLNLLRKGMAEYFYVNQIDFRAADLVRIISAPRALTSPAVIPSESRRAGTTRDLLLNPSSQKGEKQIPPLRQAQGRNDTEKDLVLTSGGKDSVVTLETLRAAKVGQAFLPASKSTGLEACTYFDCLLLNPTEAALAVAKQAGCAKPIIVRRTIDKRLLELNAAGYLNGHTPFSALLAFLGVTVATLFGHRRVIVSNERSAEEASVEYLGATINHQYSKTFEFETAFRKYCERYLIPREQQIPRSHGAPGQAARDDIAGVEYFSLLRPLYELQIAERFSKHPEYFPLFRSCNRGMATNTWCGHCPKCLFVWTVLYPFVERAELLGIFGSDLFASEGAAELLRALLGLDATKPFECVGTKEETLAALHLCVEKYKQQGIPLSPELVAIQQSVLASHSDLAALARRILASWSDQHHLPPELAATLRAARNPSIPQR
ncbi:MAG: hypothetical protein HY651_08555 [Acidobacteria bacterium]|nr:hypothetical protein [Acidobacteriota bacterium]